jgi:two-component system, NtrC family, response regulator AtoC
MAPQLNGITALVLEDDPLLRRELGRFFKEQQAEVVLTASMREAREALNERHVEVAVVDVHLPDGRSLELLEEKLFTPATVVIVMTAEHGIDVAVEAMRLGAADFLAKPFELEELSPRIHRLLQQRRSERLDEFSRNQERQADNAFYFGEDLKPLRERLERILEADQRMLEHLPPVLLVGETGTGKTSLARWIHQHGPRRDGPLVEVNCSALPEALAESELFGHERGAFTDARSARIGLFEAASGGTLFLDELPSLAALVQAKILKALEDRVIRKLGGRRDIPVDVRVIAATNQDLHRLVREESFREDLLHRLDLYRLEIPPLRERRHDLPVLAGRLVQLIARRHKLPERVLSNLGQQRLLAHAWPGNVRELSHEIERAVVFEAKTEIDFEPLRNRAAPAGAEFNSDDWFNGSYRFPESGFDLEAAILRIINHALQQSGNNITAAARLLGVPRDYVRYRLKKQES